MLAILSRIQCFPLSSSHISWISLMPWLLWKMLESEIFVFWPEMLLIERISLRKHAILHFWATLDHLNEFLVHLGSNPRLKPSFIRDQCCHLTSSTREVFPRWISDYKSTSSSDCYNNILEINKASRKQSQTNFRPTNLRPNQHQHQAKFIKFTQSNIMSILHRHKDQVLKTKFPSGKLMIVLVSN